MKKPQVTPAPHAATATLISASPWQQMNRRALRLKLLRVRYFGAPVSLKAKTRPIEPLLSTNLNAGGKQPYWCFT